MGAGSCALSLLATPLNVHVLRALDEQTTPLPDLRRAVGHPPVTTLRSYLRNLTDLGVIERHRENDFPGAVGYTLTHSGGKLLTVGEVLRRWLDSGPEGSIELGSRAARSVTTALINGWNENIVRALAARPLALTEMNRFIPGLSYPTLERRLNAMRSVGLIESYRERNARVSRYRVTHWLRESVAPVSTAVGWESLYAPDEVPALGRREVEAAFLLAMPLLSLPAGPSGACRLVVELWGDDDAGVEITICDGGMQSCVSRLEGQPDAVVRAPLLSWLRWIKGVEGSKLEVTGNQALAHVIADALRDAMSSGARACV